MKFPNLHIVSTDGKNIVSLCCIKKYFNTLTTDTAVESQTFQSTSN